MTIINGVYFSDEEYTLKEVQDILKHKKKKMRFIITDSLKDKRQNEG